MSFTLVTFGAKVAVEQRALGGHTLYGHWTSKRKQLAVWQPRQALNVINKTHNLHFILFYLMSQLISLTSPLNVIKNVLNLEKTCLLALINVLLFKIATNSGAA